MTDRLQSIRERWEAASATSGSWAHDYFKARDDIAYLLRCVEAGDALAEGAEEAKGVLSDIVDSFPDGKPPHPSIEACLMGYAGVNGPLLTWRQAREG